MAEFKLDRIRFTWKGDWETATFYTKDDIVRFGGKSYVCLEGHTSSIFYSDLEYVNTTLEPDTAEPRWVLWFDGYAWRNNWTPNTDYKLGDIVKNSGIIYVCSTPHTSAATTALGLELNLGSWTSYARIDSWVGIWTVNTRYKLNDVVHYNGANYQCTGSHISAATTTLGLESAPLGTWTMITPPRKWLTNWSINTLYKLGHTVKYGGIVYECIDSHTSASTLALGLEANSVNWQLVYNGVEYKSSWAPLTLYKLNDLVKYGASIWISLGLHTSSSTFTTANWSLYVPGVEFLDQWSSLTTYAPGDIVRYGGYSYSCITHNTNLIPSTNPSGWTLLTTGFKIQGDWNSSTAYLVGDVVRRYGQLYVAIQDSTNQETTLTAYWSLIIPGIAWRNIWAVNESYVIGDIVTFYTSSYTCILKHTASTLNTPLADTAGTYWVKLVTGDPNEPMISVGDTKIYNQTNVALPIGTSGQVYKSTGTLPEWNSFCTVGYTFYVAPNGVDLPTNGTTLNSPFATVKYACDFVTAGTQNQNTAYLLRNNKDWMVAETYQWMLYQKANNVAPFTTGSVFDQTKTIRDAGIIVDSLIYDVSRGGNSQLVTSTYSYFKPGTNTFFNTTVASQMPFFIAALNKLLELTQNAISNTAPAQSYQALNNSGAIAKPQTINIAYTAEINSNTLINSLMSILITALTNVSISGIPQITAGLQATIFIKTGTYNEMLPISVPVDTALVGDEIRSTVIQPALGNNTSDMFYVRNGSGIRNMTLKGLSGTLGSLNQYLTRRPTAGAYVSLDPGSSTSDSSVWITTRSPYVQNVTTFGTGCTGLKVDGSLHASGNKSVVANDFTQVLSDGIGVWCTGSGSLIELVSVFSYYSHIGYLSEAGGRIRATNGNSSYGDYGTVAEGYDTTETPLTGTVNNRTQHAQVASVFAGQAQNKILALEYSNAGHNYSSASFAFSGAGTGASAIADEFRDNAVFEAMLIGSTAAAGGSGYLTAGNNAQTGNTTTITLASNDKNLSTNFVGMRVIITSGTGVGQYGYIYSYDSVGKIVTVYKESTSTTGWDHIYPGTEIASVLDSTTVYSIEPRVTFSTPAFTVGSTGVTNGSSIAYGNGKFVAISSGMSFLPQYTTNGSTWSTASGVAFYNGFVAFASATNRFVGINQGNDGAGYSSDGVTWVASTLPTPTNNSRIISAGDKVAYISYNGSIRGNMLKYSQDFSNLVTWTPVNVYPVATYNQLAPDGTYTATLLDDQSTVNDSAAIEQFITIPPSSSTDYTLSLFVKQGTALSLDIYGFFNGNNVKGSYVNYVFSTSTFTANLGDGNGVLPTNLVVNKLSDGWIRLSFTIRDANNGLNNTLQFRVYPSTRAAGITGSIYVWGAQVESISRASAYIKTVATTATSTHELFTSTDGVTWNALGSPSRSFGYLAYGAGTYIAGVGESTNQIGYSYNGLTWTTVTLPETNYWTGMTYGNGRFVIVTGNSSASAFYSLDGITWTRANLPTLGYWSITYGQGMFIVTSNFGTATGYRSTDGINWTAIATGAVYSTIAIGNPNNTPRFVAVNGTQSLTGTFGTPALGRVTVGTGKIGMVKLWNPGSGYRTDPTVVQFTAKIVGTVMSVIYVASGSLANGLLLSGGRGDITTGTTISSTNIATFTGFITNTILSVTAITTGSITTGLVLSGLTVAAGTTITGSNTASFTGSISGTTLTVSAMSSGVIYTGMIITGGIIPAGTYIVSNISGAGTNSTWTVSRTLTQSSTAISGLNYVVDTSQTLASESLTGTSYVVSVSHNIPVVNMQAYTTGSAVVTITDPNLLTAAIVNCRTGNGVLGNPSFNNRGNNYQTSTTTCTVIGNGYADIYPTSKYITVSGLLLSPSPGASLIINLDTTQYKIVNITNVSTGTYYFQIAPSLTRTNLPIHGTSVEIRQRYSQVRLTGHDYLLIGSGNQITTNYPNVDTTTALAAYQVQESNQGRVFVTATDQDGNFKVGGLFSVQQATGTVTVSADLFNLSGLNQITLGGVQVGQNTVTITQFSNDSYFTANADYIVPTQKAIKTYLARLISAGGANAMTSILVAGTVGVGPQKIFSTTATKVKMNNKVRMKAADGMFLAMQFFAHGNSD